MGARLTTPPASVPVSFKAGAWLGVPMLVHVDGRDFSPAALAQGDVPVLFTATWCGFCHRILPIFKRKAQLDHAKDFVIVDVSDEDDPLWDVLNLEYVPTIMLFKDGKPGERIHGILREPQVEEFLAPVGV